MKRLLFGVLAILLLSAILLGCAGQTAIPTSAPTSSTAKAPAPTSAPPASTAQTSAPAASAPASSAAAKQIELRVATHFPGPSAMAKSLDEFDKEIEKRSNGRIKMNFFPGEALLSARDMVDGVSKGLADIGYCVLSYTPGRFPVMEVDTAIPGRPSAWVSTQVANDFYAKFKPKEWDALHVLFISANPPTGIYSKTPIRTLEDLKGKKLRCQGVEADIGKLLGAETMATPSGETYDALAKGVLDGAIYPFEAAKTFRVADATKYFTTSWTALTGADFVVIMNQDAWGKLPADLKTIFDQVSNEWIVKSGIAWNEQDILGAQYSKEKGVQVVDLSTAEAARWQQAAYPITDNYTKSMVGRGFSQSEVQSWVSFIKERRDYWLKEQIKQGIKSPNGPLEIR
jgi:TRAP-type transport system periplasmic protein